MNMLNELATLAKSLKRCGVQLLDMHQWIKPLRAGEGLIVGLGPDGRIGSVEYADAGRIGSLWKVQQSNQKKFPAVNLKGPIWLVPPDSTEVARLRQMAEKDIRGRTECLAKIAGTAQLAYDAGAKRGLWNQLHEFPRELQPAFREGESRYAAFAELIARLLALPEDAGPFADMLLNGLAAEVVARCRDGSLPCLGLVEDLLLGKWNERRKILERSETVLFFDLADYARFECRVAHPDMARFVNSRLLTQDIGSTDAKGVCSLTGESVQLEAEKFPEPKLPILGPTYLMSMNKDAPCHDRYGLISAAIFPTGRVLARELQNAVLFITGLDRRGKTWQAVPNHRKEGRRERRDLLVVYLEDKPQTSAQLASLFAGAESEGEVAQELFETTVVNVCKALKGEPGVTEESLLRLFVLTKVDPGRKQVLLSTTFSVRSVLQGATEWQIAAMNRPQITVLLPGRKGEKPRPAEPHCPSPAELMRTLQRQWIRDRTRFRLALAPGCRLQEVYEVFLSAAGPRLPVAERLLSLCLQRNSALLLGVGGAAHNGNWGPFSEESGRSALTTISVISLLLFKCGHRKEVYMKGPAFQVGQLLALADTLHREYCQHVRKGETPPQLIGNALMSAAIENPQRGLARLGERVIVYYAWANTAHGEHFRLAKWALAQMGRVSHDLADCELPETTSDAQRAEMLLGYLARPSAPESDRSL